MPALTKPKQIDDLMEQASRSLVSTNYFEAERVAQQALLLAREAEDFGRMARIVLPLQEARRLRTQQALDLGNDVGIHVITESISEESEIEPGCFLIQPPQVGADARRMRLFSQEREVPIAVVCREPTTRLGLCPVVAIAPGVTLRTKIDPPIDPDNVGLEWFVDAMEQLGDFAVDSIDVGLAVRKRIDLLLSRLDALPEHEGLHHALTSTCREAERTEN